MVVPALPVINSSKSAAFPIITLETPCSMATKALSNLGIIPANICLFFFQAEDGIRDWSVTGVQTCALPIQAEDGIRHWSVTGVQTCALPIFFCLRSEEQTFALQSLTNLVCPLFF